MIKGAIFKFKDHVSNILYYLLKGINLNDWCFELINWESYGEDEVSIELNKMDNIDSNFIKTKIIENKADIFPEFAEIYISSKPKNSYSNIETYADFMASNYFLTLSIIDHKTIEICCKNYDFLKKIIDNFDSLNLNKKSVVLLKQIHPESKLSPWHSKDEKGIYEYIN